MGKAKRLTKVAKGRLARALVLRGKKERTVGGLRSTALMRNSRGKIVSKRASANGKQRYKNIEDWTAALMEARGLLQTKGFVAVNGKSLQGKALYVRAKSLWRRQGSVPSAASP